MPIVKHEINILSYTLICEVCDKREDFDANDLFWVEADYEKENYDRYYSHEGLPAGWILLDAHKLEGQVFTRRHAIVCNNGDCSRTWLRRNVMEDIDDAT